MPEPSDRPRAHTAVWRAADFADALGSPQPGDVIRYADPHTGIERGYEYASWTTPVTTPGLGFAELIASWNADTPPGTFVRVEARAHAGQRSSGWFVLANWTSGDGAGDIARTTVDGQSDALARVDADTLVAAPDVRFDRYELRATLLRPHDADAAPTLRLLAAVASVAPEGAQPVSVPTAGVGVVLDVPAYSQYVHRGHHARFGGGGASWCSPTSVAMVLDFFGAGPTPAESAWADAAGETRPQVDHAARMTYDHAYGGCGTWPFNTAYAATRGLTAYVTRLGDLNDVGRLVDAGQPVVVSIHDASTLTGAGYTTQGHLLLIVGFDAAGDVICHDPAAHGTPSDAGVRVIFRRDEFEREWLGSGATAYVVRSQPAGDGTATG